MEKIKPTAKRMHKIHRDGQAGRTILDHSDCSICCSMACPALPHQDYNRVSITISDMKQATPADQGLYSGLIRLHILHHACQEPIFGLGMIEELARHGYRLSPGTLYPIVHSLEKRGLLRSKQQQVNGKIRRVYSATAGGQKTLKLAKQKVRELFGELF